ncbi:MAG: prolipoprotein diacylglyceryl transferase family protein [Chloroflexota bacterium]
MLPVLNIGPLAVQVAGLILLIGIWVGLNRSEAFARRQGMDVERLNSLILYLLLAGILAARLGFVIQNFPVFIEHPLDAFSLSPQMLDLPSALAAMFLTGLIYGQRIRLEFWNTLDALTPAFAVLMMAVALMNLASGDGFGVPARLPWSIYLFDEWRHPTQVYDLIFAALIWRIVESSPPPIKLPAGIRFLSFMFLSAFGRIVVDAFRAEAVIAGLGGVRVTQVAALVWMILAGILMMKLSRSRKVEEG